MHVTTEGVDALRDVDRPVVERTVGGRELLGNVHGALRLLVTDPEASTAEGLGSVATDVMWSGEMSVPRNLPAEEMTAQTHRQMEMTQRVETELGARRPLYLEASSIRHSGPVKPTEHGYGLLVDGGPGPSGEPEGGRRVIRPGGAGNRLRARGRRRDPPAEPLRLAGGCLGTVLRLDSRRRRLDAGPVMADPGESIQTAALADAPPGLWVVARGLNETAQRTPLWVQPVRFRPADGQTRTTPGRMMADANEGVFRKQDDSRNWLPDCDRNDWGDAVSCASGQAASGLRVYFDRTDSRQANVGLQLVCRRVVAAPEE